MLIRASKQFLAAAFAVVGLMSSAAATPVSYDFFVNWNIGELAGTTSSGWFAFDSTLAAPDTEYRDPDLLTGFGFTVRGTTFGLADVKTGLMSFDHAGFLREFLVGTDCGFGYCGVGAGNPGAFYLTFTQYNVPNRLDSAIGDPVGMSMGVGDIPSAPVPEPATVALALLALGAAGAASRRKRPRP